MRQAINKHILDACCGGRLMWVNKQDPRVLAQDKRWEHVTFNDRGSVRTLRVAPDHIGDFRKMDFQSDTFSLVLFDPPHLLHAGEGSWLFKKYGRLDAEKWQDDLKAGFSECIRVLRPHGTLVFKWNTYQLSKDKVETCFPCQPVFMSKQGKTYFYIFVKDQV